MIEELHEVYDAKGKFVALFLYKADAQLFKQRNGYAKIRTVKRNEWSLPS